MCPNPKGKSLTLPRCLLIMTLPPFDKFSLQYQPSTYSTHPYERVKTKRHFSEKLLLEFEFGILLEIFRNKNFGSSLFMVVQLQRISIEIEKKIVNENQIITL